MFHHSFVYVNVFWNCKDTFNNLKSSIFQEKQSYISTNLRISKDFLTPNGSIFQEKQCYIQQFTNFEIIVDSKWLLYPENYLQEKKFENMVCRDLQDNFYHPTKTMNVFHFSKIDFAVEWQNKGTFSMLLIYHLMKYF